MGLHVPEGRIALGIYHRSSSGRTIAGHSSSSPWGWASHHITRSYSPGRGWRSNASASWDAALEQLRQAYTLDPRSLSAARALAYACLMVRRYPEALAVVDPALARESTARMFELKAMIHLAEGDLPQARAVVRAALRAGRADNLIYTIGYFSDLKWVLEEPRRRLPLQLAPGEFDDNRASWGLVLAQTYALRRDLERTGAYADTARIAFEEQIEGTAADPSYTRSLPGVTLAYLGRKADAVRTGQRGMALATDTERAQSLEEAYVQHQLVRIYLLAGEREKALDQLEPLLESPSLPLRPAGCALTLPSRRCVAIPGLSG